MATPAQRKQQGDAVRQLIDQWEAAANDWDAKAAAQDAAIAQNNAAFTAWNAVAWKTAQGSGQPAAAKAAAYQLEAAWEEVAQALPALQAAAVQANLVRGGFQIKAEGAVQALKQNPGASENMGGTQLP